MKLLREWWPAMAEIHPVWKLRRRPGNPKLHSRTSVFGWHLGGTPIMLVMSNTGLVGTNYLHVTEETVIEGDPYSVQGVNVNACATRDARIS